MDTRRALVTGLLLIAMTAALAQDGQMQLVRLNFADAEFVAGMLGGAAPQRPEPDPDRFARETIADAVRRLPQADGQWQQSFAGRSYPGSEGPAIQPPPGLSQPPVAIPQQNAILLRGTPEALDRTEEIIAMLDQPQAMVNIELALVDDPREQVEQWGLDFRAMGDPLSGGSVGNAPPTGLQLRYGIGNLQALLGWDIRRTRGSNVTGTNVTTFNNTPATISFGQVLPFFVTHVTYDWWGRRHVDTEPYSIFTGIELWVHPRINGDDSVTMRLSPTIVEAAGAVTAPDGSSIPITRNVITDTQVRVRDGESMVIGGLQRSSDEVTDRFRSLLGERRVTRSSHPVLVVTPRIIRP